MAHRSGVSFDVNNSLAGRVRMNGERVFYTYG
jgi:hypothetical protein